MSTTTPTTPIASRYQPGKPPLLEGRTAAAVKLFLSRLAFYFLSKDIAKTKNALRIGWLGQGISEDSELHAWFKGDEEAFMETTWEKFVPVFLRRALPRDYVWDVLTAIRRDRQGSLEYTEWATRIKGRQAEVGLAIVPDTVLVAHMLFNMDPELRRFLRQHAVLLNSGLHEDYLDSAAAGLVQVGPTLIAPAAGEGETTVVEPVAVSVDYVNFDRVARDKWNLISASRAAVFAQVAAISKGTRGIAITPSPNTSPRKPTTGTPAATTTPSGAVPGRLLKLTDRQRAYLYATSGCLKCRKTNQTHMSPDCPNGFAVVDVVVPNGWVDPLATGVPAAPVPLNTAVLNFASDQDTDSDAHSSDFDSDEECVDLTFPPLELRIGDSATGSSLVTALTDSGCASSVITAELVKQLGLVRHNLKVPRVVKLAVKGAKEKILRVHSYVFAHVELANGLWSAGKTFFKVIEGDFDVPFDIILGNPFMVKNNISIHYQPHIQLRVTEPGSSSFIDLFTPVATAQTFEEAKANMEERDIVDVKLRSVEKRVEELIEMEVAAAVMEEERKEKETEKEKLKAMDAEVRLEFPDIFPTDLPSVKDMPDRPVRHNITFIEPKKPHNLRGYPSPTRYQKPWRMLLDTHLEAGRIRPSKSPYASPCFIIPKADPTVLPRWVNDYRVLNTNTVKDRTPLPLPDEILARIAKAKMWGKIDMTNSFFQTKVAEEDIEKTAVKTPWGLYEWVVMPMGLCNSPATHQRRVNEALGALIGDICYVYIDDIIIFSDSLEEHQRNTRTVLQALRDAGLYASPKKTDLFTLETGFLGHVISTEGIRADPHKVQKIIDWTVPRTAKQVRGFLGLVQYLKKFVVGLAQQTAVLTPLTKKGIVSIKGLWGAQEQQAFDSIKTIITSLPCLRSLDYESEETIFVMTDASNAGVGAVLLQGETWQTARPCGFYSRQFLPAEAHYPTHEQELLAIVAALKAWRIELLGVHFKVLTDHDTLKHLKTQKTLSKRQARWTELLADYDYELSYIPGEQNTVADSLSRYSFGNPTPHLMVAGISVAALDKSIIARIKAGYTTDPDCTKMLRNVKSSPAWQLIGGVLYFENRIVVPADASLREVLLHDAHDVLGHLGSRKTYSAVSLSYFWPTLRRDVISYVRSCDGCQRNKARTSKVAGELHSLPVPKEMFTDISLDFVGPLPLSGGFDMLMTVTCRLTGYARLIPCMTTDGARKCAERLYEGWHRFFGIPERMVSDRDKLFVSEFWRGLYRRMGVRLQMSSAFHPETDGRSEITNKTAIQILRMWVARNQKDWFSRLGDCEFALNAMENVSTGKSPFSLVLGYTPTLTPTSPALASEPASIEEILEERTAGISEAQDSLAIAKLNQAEQANVHRAEEPDWKVGDKVMIDSRDRRLRYKAGKKEKRSAKLFNRHDGPYTITQAHPEESRYTLELGVGDKSFAKFHVSKLKRYVENDTNMFPTRVVPEPPAVIIGGEEEHQIDSIIDQRPRGRGIQFLVRWTGHPTVLDSWEPSRNFEDTVALTNWEILREAGGA
ncbi:hypothetical protein P7C70_g4211, partial [Phenoliferia sp. Uapishka_3]